MYPIARLITSHSYLYCVGDGISVDCFFAQFGKWHKNVLPFTVRAFRSQSSSTSNSADILCRNNNIEVRCCCNNKWRTFLLVCKVSGKYQFSFFEVAWHNVDQIIINSKVYLTFYSWMIILQMYKLLHLQKNLFFFT